MSKYPIEATSISFNEIKQNLMDFVQSKPDAIRWRDFYTGGEGTILIELIAGYGFYNTLKIIFSREETYLQYVNTLTSARAIALDKAYSAFRGTNRRYRVRFIPSVSVSIPAFTVIGYCGDYDFICLEDTKIEEGHETTIYGAVGTFKSLAIEAPSSDLQVFRFNDDNISDDYRLYLNDKILTTTSVNMNALEDNWLVQSNAVGGVNATYLNLAYDPNDENMANLYGVEFTQGYQKGDILRLDYIQYQNIPYSTDIHIDYTDEVTVDSTENPIVPETIESIQVKAPIMYETQQLIRGREDYSKNFLQLRASFSDTTERDLSAAYVELSYSQYDRTLMTDSELAAVMKALTYKRMFGIPMPYINKPRFMEIDVDVNLKLNASSITLTNYTDIVANVFSKFEYKFSDELEEIRIDLAELERLLEKEENIKRANISAKISKFKEDSWYKLGDTFYDENFPKICYRVTNVCYQTHTDEPRWNYTKGSITPDGAIMWEAIPKSGEPGVWQAKESIPLYTTKIPTNPLVDGIMFRAVQGKSTSSIIPADVEWNSKEIGDLTDDNMLIWQSVNPVTTADDWEPNTWYNLGDIKNVKGNSYQVVGERRKSSMIQPDFTDEPDTLIYENMILTKEILTDEIIELPWGTYCIIKPNITMSID